MDQLHVILANPSVRATLMGALGAAAADIHAWRTSPTWKVDGFNWGTASKRWVTGAITGFAIQNGLSELLGL